MIRLAWVGILLIACGLGLLMVASQTRSCMTDYDSTICKLTPNVASWVVGLVLIGLGSGLGVRGLRATR